MATYTPLRLAGPAQLSTSATDVYTVPSSKKTVVKQIVFNNTSASPVTVTAYVIPVGSSASVSTAIISALSIAPNSQIIWSADVVLNTAGEKLSLLAGTANAVTYIATGIEIA